MNRLLRAIVKIFLVVLQPITALAFIIASFTGSETAVVVTGVLVVTYNIASAIVLYALLGGITILPNVKIEKIPQFGLSVGLTEGGGIALLIPFLYIEFNYKTPSASN